MPKHIVIQIEVVSDDFNDDDLCDIVHAIEDAKLGANNDLKASKASVVSETQTCPMCGNKMEEGVTITEEHTERIQLTPGSVICGRCFHDLFWDAQPPSYY